jgi:hypothetical protein
MDFHNDNSILAECARNLPVEDFAKESAMVDCYLINPAFTYNRYARK